MRQGSLGWELGGSSLFLSFMLLHMLSFALWVPPSPSPRPRCAHLHMHTPTGSHNHGDDSISLVPVLQAKGGRSLTKFTYSTFPQMNVSVFNDSVFAAILWKINHSYIMRITIIKYIYSSKSLIYLFESIWIEFLSLEINSIVLIIKSLIICLDLNLFWISFLCISQILSHLIFNAIEVTLLSVLIYRWRKWSQKRKRSETENLLKSHN